MACKMIQEAQAQLDLREFRARWIRAINGRPTNNKITAIVKNKKENPFTRLMEATWAN